MSTHLINGTEISGGALDTLWKLFFFGSQEPGDIPSKAGAAELIGAGWARLNDGHDYELTTVGRSVAGTYFSAELVKSILHAKENEQKVIVLERELAAMTKDRDFFRLSAQLEAKHREDCKVQGVPDWRDHNWPQVFFSNGRWYGTQLGFKPEFSYDYKGFESVSLLREHGAFICEGYFEGTREESVTVRPPEFWPVLSDAVGGDAAWAEGALLTARNLSYNKTLEEGYAKFTLLEMANRILEHRVDRIHKKKDGYLMLSASGRCRFMTWKERLAYVLFGAVPTWIDSK